MASFGLLPAELLSAMSATARFLLLIAIAALGYKTSLGALSQVGMRPVVVIVTATIGLAVLVLAAVALLPEYYG